MPVSKKTKEQAVVEFIQQRVKSPEGVGVRLQLKQPYLEMAAGTWVFGTVRLDKHNRLHVTYEGTSFPPGTVRP